MPDFKFKLGDRVTLNSAWERLNGCKGTVIVTHHSYYLNYTSVRVRFDDGEELSCTEEELELIKPKKRYADWEYA